MNGLSEVRSGQQVLGSDGGMIGTVEGVEGDVIAVRGAAEHGAGHHHVPADWIDHVDAHVHLNRTAALARETWTSHTHAGGGAPTAAATAAPMPHRTEGKKGSWLPWLMLAILVAIALVVLFRGFAYQDDPSTSQPNPATESDAAK
jgi:hypothetical protein